MHLIIVEKGIIRIYLNHLLKNYKDTVYQAKGKRALTSIKN